MKMLNKNLAILAVIVALGFVMVACEDDERPQDPLFESHTNFAIRVSNKSAEDLVAFKGSLTKANLIGGVLAKTDNHGFKNDRAIFPANPTSFQMLFITREQYEKNKNNPSALSGLTNSVYIRTYVFWNGDYGDNDKVYEISQKLGGMHRLQIWNNSNYDVEFRENGTAGATIGYAPKGMALTYLNVDSGDYLIYPVFQRYNSRRDVMETIIPVRDAEPPYIVAGPFFYQFAFPPTATTTQTRMLNLHDAVSKITSMKSGVVYVYINNLLTTSGLGVRAYRGSIPMVTPAGNEVIDAGDIQEFAILLPQQGGTYMEELSASFGVMVGANPTVPVKTVENNAVNFTLKGDMMYTINITNAGPTIELRTGYEGGPKSFAPEADTGETTPGITGTSPDNPS